MENNLTIFFVKPHMISKRKEIFEYLRKNIEAPEDFYVLFRGRFTNTPKSFWREFYSHLEKDYPKQLEKMADEFESYDLGIDISLIKGKNITQRVKKITGPTLYEKNPDYTIRGHFGHYELPNTIVHCSDSDDVKREIKVLRQYFPIM